MCDEFGKPTFDEGSIDFQTSISLGAMKGADDVFAVA